MLKIMVAIVFISVGVVGVLLLVWALFLNGGGRSPFDHHTIPPPPPLKR